MNLRLETMKFDLQNTISKSIESSPLKSSLIETADIDKEKFKKDIEESENILKIFVRNETVKLSNIIEKQAKSHVEQAIM